ncbi:MAG TPA: endoribonuclease MazF [Candidatus Polarisedimenticolaceae bacterium]|nr:endoribonuclease MazF [Candidatus Polarisedimenticolaceae bacterium]
MGRPPARGDLVWLEFDPQVGSEQAGRRPALVLSPKEYNGKVGLALCCPITSHAKGYPFEVALPESLGIRGVVLCDQIKSLDWRGRRARRITSVPDEVMHDVTGRVLALVDPDGS